MILRFPSDDVLCLAITSEVTPQSISLAPAHAAIDDSGCVWIQPDATVARGVLAELKRLGVTRKRSCPTTLRPIRCWHEALPPSPSDHIVGAAEVLFQLQNELALPEFIIEILRLGNDRQSFAHVSGPEPCTLLRVIDPPHYTLLRSIDALDGSRAFTQMTDGVWVEYGFEHPLARHLRTDPGQWLLIRGDGTWQWHEQPNMKDVYQTLDFSVGADHVPLTGDREPSRIPVPVRLRESSSTDSAELWVITRDSMAQIESFLSRMDDAVLARLAFAVSHSESDDPTVVLRVRPSPDMPPILVLDALACRPYLRIPNLFLPIGTRLQPPLRRDAVIQLLASEGDRIHWLKPQSDGTFVPQSIADSAFRPLSDWVDYVIDHHAEPLKAWIASHQFDFEPFIGDDVAVRPVDRRPQNQRDDQPTSSEQAEEPKQAKTKRAAKRKRAKTPERETLTLSGESPDERSNEWQTRLHGYETAYRVCEEPLDDPTRSDLWLKMGEANGVLSYSRDTTICFGNGLWGQAIIAAPSDAGTEDRDASASSIKDWLRSECRCAGMEDLTADQFAQRLASQQPQDSYPGLVVAQIVHAAASGSFVDEIQSRRPETIEYLQRHESFLPIRAAWMAWVSMYHLGGDDVLLLARARDRLLERLFHRGLAPEYDLPAFLRIDAAAENDRFRVLRDHFLDFRDQVQQWILEPELSSRDPQTKAYVDLVFSYALARLGETASSQQLLASATERLENSDVVHAWVLRAYAQRIGEAFAGRDLQGTLSPKLMDELSHLDRGQQYVVDRLRQRSRILEPHLRIDPFGNFLRRTDDELSQALAELPKIDDQDRLREQLDSLLRRYDAAEDLVRILPDALQIVPRLGERYAGQLIDRIWAALDACRHAFEKAVLLHRGIMIAAHYGRVDQVQMLVGVMDEALPDLVRQYLSLTSADRSQADAIEGLLSQSFRGMRRLGMRDEIGTIYGRVADLLESTSDRESSGQSDRLALRVASGWYFFGETERADEIAKRVLQNLQGEANLDPPTTRLLCAYLEAVSNAPIEQAFDHVRAVFSTDAHATPTITNRATSMTTDTHFSIAHLDVVEAAVISLISDDFALSPETRRWLDEDEYLVRSRIHRDMRLATEHANRTHA